jgi:drug/metabolite transporter (DMT)-like permease
MSILFGFLAAASWGSANFAGGLSSRRAGAYQSAIFIEVAGAIFLPVLAVLTGEVFPPWQDWLWCAAARVLGALAMVLFYRAYVSGKFSLVTPVVAVTGAALPVLTGFFLEGALGVQSSAGIILALVSVWLIAFKKIPGENRTGVYFADLKLPLLAGVGFGLYFILLHLGSTHGLFWPLAISRWAGALTLFILFRIQRQPLLSGTSTWPLLLLAFLLDASGSLFYILAGQTGRMDIAVVLGSLYPGVTILLSWLALKERISRTQLAGILVALCGIVLLTI